MQSTSTIPISLHVKDIDRSSIPINVYEQISVQEPSCDAIARLVGSPPRIRRKLPSTNAASVSSIRVNTNLPTRDPLPTAATITACTSTSDEFRHDLVVDESGRVRLENKLTHKLPPKVPTKQSSFELTSLFQNIFSGSGLQPGKEKSSNISERNGSHISGLSSFLPLRLNEENLSCSNSQIGNSQEQRHRTYSLDKFKMNKSESSDPLLNYTEHAFTDYKITDKENVNPIEQPATTEDNLRFIKLAEPISVSKLLDENEPRSPSKKRECSICSDAAEKQRRLREEVTARVSVAARRLARRRDTLRPQGSLDSACDRNSAGPIKGWTLTRSGSLDLPVSCQDELTSSTRGNFLNNRNILGGGDTSLSTSQDSLQSDTGGAPTLHRYYHVFRGRELDQLIEKYVQNLHIISSYYDHANWCIIAEKVQVWTI